MQYSALHPSLVSYVEKEIIPRYTAFDKAHNLNHVQTVIQESVTLASHYEVDMNMVYVIAAYHDTGLVEGREFHHLASGKILTDDSRLKEWFTEEQILIMKEAVEDHRASADMNPERYTVRLLQKQIVSLILSSPCVVPYNMAANIIL